MARTTYPAAFVISFLVAVPAWSVPTPTATMPCAITVRTPVRFDFMQTPLRNITPSPLPGPFATPTVGATPTAGGGAAGFDTDPVVQRTPGFTPNIEFSDGFEGVEYAGLGVSDANGDVGPYQYVQWVNNAFAVFNKTTGAIIYGPAPGSTLFRGFGGGCEDLSRGDPLVLYDQLAHRWILTVLANSAEGGGGGPQLPPAGRQCIAVSKTEDATGQYYRYEYEMPLGFPDYPKFGLWPDAYYYTAGAFNQTLACAFHRLALLLGQSSPVQCCLLPTGVGNHRLLPSDMDGTRTPDSGTPNYLVNLNKGDTKALQLWKFHVNFLNPNNSTFLGPISDCRSRII